MNILFITLTYPPSANGVSLSTARITDELRRLGHTVGIVGPQTNQLPNHVAYFPLPVIKNLPILPRDYPLPIPILSSSQKKVIQRIPWQIIHVQHPSLMITLARTLGKKCNTPVVFTYHTQYDTYINHYGWWLPISVRRFLYQKTVIEPAKHTQGVIVLVQWMKRKLEDFLKPTPLYFVPTSGVPAIFFQREVRPLALCKSMRRPLFLSVGRLSREKNLDFLLTVMKEWFVTNAGGALVVIGDGREKKKLMRLSQSLGISSHVHFLGKVSDSELVVWHRAADLLLFTSVTETSPMTLLEAMAGGLPVVAIDHEATREIIANGKNGVLADFNVTMFISAMTQALEKRRDLSAHAKKTASAYTITSSTKKLIRVYQRVVRAYKKI